MGYLRLLRPVNSLIAAISVLVGYFIVSVDFLSKSLDLVLLSLTAFCITGYGNAINDLLDVEIDSKNRPHRPIVSGEVTPKNALRLSTIFLVVGLLFARFVGREYFYVASGIALILWLYSAYLKSTVLWGNLTVAFLASFTMPFGASLAGNVSLSLWPMLFAFIIHIAREIVKDMADMEGDKSAGCVTLPVRYGMRASSLVVCLVLGLLLGILPLPWVHGYYGKFYVVIVIATVIPLILYAAFAIITKPEVRIFDRASGALRYAMLAGLAAILLGRF